MSIKIIRVYGVSVVGDGVATSVAIDFHDAIQADVAVHSKTPVGFLEVTSSVEPGGVTGVLAGTVMTFTYTTALAAAQTDGLQAVLEFNGT